MGRGMASHTAWRARVTVKGIGQGRKGTQEPEMLPTTAKPPANPHRVSLGNARYGPTVKWVASPKTWR